MALTTKHTKVATLPDDPAYEVGTTEWNDDHTILVGDKSFVGKSTAGAGSVAEISMATAKTMLDLAGSNSGDQTLSDATISTTDITTNNVSSAKHGFAPKSTADNTQFLRGGATPAFDAITALDVTFPSIGATANVKSVLKDMFSAGWIEGGEIAVDGANTVQVAAGGGLARLTNSPTGEMVEVYWDTVTGQSVPANTERYVYWSYNGGSPAIILSATHPTDLHTNIFLGEVHNVGGVMSIHEIQRVSGDFAHRLQDWLTAIIGTRIESGSTFSEPAARKIALTSGIAYATNFAPQTVPAFDSNAGGTFTNYYRDGTGGFTTEVTQTTWENTKYDNNSGTLAAMTASYYANRWVMISFTGEVGVLYGQAEYATQSAAQAEAVPTSVPTQWGFDDHGFMCAQITFQKSASTYAAVADIRPRIGGSTAVGGASVHNDLSGKQGGTAGEYYHLTSAQATVVGNTSGTNTGDQTTIAGITGTIAQFNTAVTDADFATLAGAESLTNKTLGDALILAENAALLLDPALSADGKYNGITRAGVAGAALAFGDLCHLSVADGRWELADANSASGAIGDARGVLGICVLAAADTAATTMLLHGIVRADAAFPAMTVNAPMYVSETAGDITETQPVTTDVVIKVVGFALTADELFFNPDNSYITHI